MRKVSECSLYLEDPVKTVDGFLGREKEAVPDLHW